MDSSVWTIAATMPVNAPTMAPSPAFKATGVVRARSLTAIAAAPTTHRQQTQLAALTNGIAERRPATAPAVRAGRK